MTEIKFTGLKELAAAIENIKSKTRNKLVMRALHDGARIVRNEAKLRVPVGTELHEGAFRRNKDGTYTDRIRRRGLIKANIVEHADRNVHFRVLIRVRNSGYRRAGPRGGLAFKNPGSSPGYWWLVEFGTSKTPAQPFMRPAFEAKKIEAVKVIADSMRRGIEAVSKGSE